MWARGFRRLLIAWVLPVRQGIKGHRCNATIHLLRAIILAGAVGAALAIYFIFSLYVFPQSFQASVEPSRPEALITAVSLSRSDLALGEKLVISVTGTNRGDRADMQIVSIGFPNFTSPDSIRILQHDFRQTPFTINATDPVGSGYAGTEETVNATYASIEAFSRPWETGSTYTIKLEVTPEAEGNFIIVVKAVALPHTWDGAHYPREGTMDYQSEFVDQYSVKVTKP